MAEQPQYGPIAQACAQARAMGSRELRMHPHDDHATRYACALSAVEAHLADMYRRFGIPDEHRELVDPTCHDR